MEDLEKKYSFRAPLELGIKPVWNSESKILMVGSITSIDGMKSGYYYSSRYNSFWKLLDFVVLSKRKNLDFERLEKLFVEDKNQFVFSLLKQRLNENFKNNYDKDIDLFKKNLKEIQSEFECELLKSNIAICDIFKSCYAKRGSSLDSDIVLNDSKLPYQTYKETLNDIIEKSKVSVVVPNSKFVNSWLEKFEINKKQKVKIVQTVSPSATRRLKLSVKFEDWKTKLFDFVR